MSDCLLEQLTEVATVTNEEGLTEELYILHPPKPSSEFAEEQISSSSISNKSSSGTLRDTGQLSNADPTTPSTGTENANDLVPPIRSRGRPSNRTKELMKNSRKARNNKTPSKTEVGEEESSDPDVQPRKKLPSLNYKDYKGFPCTTCGKVFTLKGNLKVHLRTHNDERPFQCSFTGCSKTFRSKDILAKHEMAHNGVKPWECDICHKGFSSKISMVEHQSRHNNTKPYKCKQCGVEFRQYSCLSRHYMVHREEYPHQCNVCNKRFKSKVYLTSHMRVHTGETPFPCTVCAKKFKHQSDLRRHSIIHTGLKPYTCSLCGVKFSDNSACRRHEREHNGQKPFDCHVCGETYKRQGQLKQHLLKKHSSNGQLSASDTAVLMADQQQENQPSAAQQGLQVAVLEFPAQSVPQTSEATTRKIEKRMITHHVAVPKVKGKAVGVDPVALLDHIKDQLEPSQMPQTVDGQPVQVSCKVLKEDRKQQIVELQYLSTVHVKCNDKTVEKDQEQQKESLIWPSLELTGEITDQISEIIDNVKKEDDNPNIVCKIEVEPQLVTQSDPSSSSFVTLHMEEDNIAAVSNSALELHVQPTQPQNILTSPETDNFVSNPDFSKQEYYNWLSAFAEACKAMTMPLDTELFEKISMVNKKLADVMANPKGALSNKSNFIISMSISKELAAIIDKHLAYVLTALDNNDHEDL